MRSLGNSVPLAGDFMQGRGRGRGRRGSQEANGWAVRRGRDREAGEWAGRAGRTVPPERRACMAICPCLPRPCPNCLLSFSSFSPFPSPSLHSLHTEKQKKPAERKDLIYKAHRYAKKAIELDPEDFAGHKWAGITLSLVGDFEGTKVLSTSQDRRKMNLTLKYAGPNCKLLLNSRPFYPSDWTEPFRPNLSSSPWSLVLHFCWHVLVSFFFFFFFLNPQNWSWTDDDRLMKKIASALFATPPSSTYEEALSHFLAGSVYPTPPSSSHIFWISRGKCETLNK